MSFKGMGYHLSAAEQLVLLAFNADGELGFPVGIHLDTDETLKLLQEMTRKDIIVGRAPYRLTKLGKRLKQSIT